MEKSSQPLQQQKGEDTLKTKYKIPVKEIKNPMFMAKFLKGKCYMNIMQFIADLQASVKNKPISSTKENPKFKQLIAFQDKMEKIMEDTPPVQMKCRFGNLAFKTFHSKIEAIALTEIADLLPEGKKDAAVELNTYILDSFGSNVRIDYGTGHELAFLTFLYCLVKLGVYDKTDYEGLVHLVFNKYIQLMRRLQLLYKLEPAGSHGVWGLDDYHFLPFLFGAAELLNHEFIRKPEDAMVEKNQIDFADDYMYINALAFIKKIKVGVPLSTSSPQLWNISGAASWTKICNGMIKMYQKEVLHKFPIVQHIYFGTIYKFE